jgi:DNA-binding NarL/FixJ family response regulator
MAKNASAIPAAALAPKRRILIVDDHPMMREGLRGIINREPDLQVSGEAQTAREALSLIEKNPFELGLVDITLPDKNGLELVKDLRAVRPQLALLALSMHDDQLYAERMLRAGARGYLNKHQPPEELLKAIRLVLDGQLYVSQEISKTLTQRISGSTKKTLSPLETLTDREFEILQLLGAGKSSKEIAALLHLSDKTVAVHAANLRHKLRLKNTAQLIRFAVQAETALPSWPE